MRFHGVVLLAAGLFAGLCQSAAAAELKLTYADLVKPVQAVMDRALIHLNDVPGPDGQPNVSMIQVGGQEIPVELPVKTVDLFGSTYAYYVSNVDSSKVTATAVKGAMRVTVTFATQGPALVAGCATKTGCSLTSGLPVVNWNKPSLAIDIVPIHVKNGLGLWAAQVQIGGTFDPECKSSDLISAGTCDLALIYANSVVRTLRNDINAAILSKMNATDTQTKIATALLPFLEVPVIGDVTIDELKTDSTSIDIKFTITGETEGK